VLPDGDVAIMMVEAEATEKTIQLVAGGATAPTEEVVAQGLEAAKPFIKALCEAQSALAEKAAKPVADFPRFLDYQDDVYAAVESAALSRLTEAQAIPGKQERNDATDALKDETVAALAGQFEGREKEISAAFRAVTKKVVRQRILRDKAVGRGRGRAARARLGAVRARRDPDPRDHHAEHAPHGAAAGHALARDAQAVHAQLQLPAVLHR
jgi:polyribonucleotide nucleotidyltransferase